MSSSNESTSGRNEASVTSPLVAGENVAFVASAPESLPRLTVPGLSANALGISAEVLAQIPTLIEQCDATPVPDSGFPVEVPSVPSSSVFATADSAVPADMPQGLPSHVESWEEQFQNRIDLLTGDIHKLNSRLDHIADILKA